MRIDVFLNQKRLPSFEEIKRAQDTDTQRRLDEIIKRVENLKTGK
jgi:hypothetical protein